MRAKLVFFFENHDDFYFFLSGLFIISIVSFIDDIFDLNQISRLIFQIISVLFILAELKIFVLPIFYQIAMIILLLGWLNTFNFMDGINGISILYCTVSLSTFYLIPALADFKILIEYLFSAVIIFAWLNLRNKPISFLGDVGSVSIAYILSFLMVFLILESNKIEYLFLFTIYGTDSVITILKRLINKENIFYPHRSHLYQKLVHEKNFSHIIVAVIYSVLQAVINVILLTVVFPNKYSIVLCIVMQIMICIIYISIRRLYIKD